MRMLLTSCAIQSLVVTVACSFINIMALLTQWNPVALICDAYCFFISRFAFISAELLSSEVLAISEKILASKAEFQCLLNFLLDASYFNSKRSHFISKIVCSLLNTHYKDTLNEFRQLHDVVTRISLGMQSSSVAEVLNRLICPSEYAKRQFEIKVRHSCFLQWWWSLPTILVWKIIWFLYWQNAMFG